jgi:hypothetical protein
MMEDKKMAAKMGMTMKEWEASQADKMHDMPSKGRTKKMDGGSMDADDEPRKGPYHIVHQKTGKVVGKANTLNGARKSRERNDMNYGSYAHQIIDTATGKATMKDGGRAAKADGGGLYANIHAKRERIEDGSKEKMRKPGAKGAPSASDFKDAAKTAKNYGGRAAKADGGGNMSPESLRDLNHSEGNKKFDKISEELRNTYGSHTKDMNRGTLARLGDEYLQDEKLIDSYGSSAPNSRSFMTLSPTPPSTKRSISNVDSLSTPKKFTPSPMKKGGKTMHHKDCMCKACGGAAMSEEGGRMARKSGGKVGKSNISINIYPHNAEKPGAGPMPPMGAPPTPPMPAPMMKPPMPAPSPMPSAPPPAHMSLPPGLQQALAGAAGAGPMPPAGGGMPAPMMGRKAGGKVVYPITGGAGGGRARKEKVDAYGEKMNKDLRK